MRRRVSLAVALLLFATGVAIGSSSLLSPASAASRTLTVGPAGSGSAYRAVQAAVNAVPANNTTPTTITVAAGTYREVVSIPSNKPYITLVGATGRPTDVVITYNRAAGTRKPDGSTYGTAGSATMTIAAPNTTVRALTIENSFNEAASGLSSKQAVALLTKADRLVFDNTRFLGNQDTLYANSAGTAVAGRQYYRNCYIEGDVDFIFGNATAVFDGCTIRSLNRGSASNNGYVTAASTQISQPYGFLFTHCSLTSDAAANSVHLGRPWHPSGDPNARGMVVFRDSTLGAHIRRDAPWTDMSGFSWKTGRFFEYQNTGPGAAVTSNRPQLSASQAASYTAQNPLRGGDDWNPLG